MWKQTVGDWQERRQRRRGEPTLNSPQANLPDSVDATESILRGFLPREFHDHVPEPLCPASDGPETRPQPPRYTPLEQQTLGCLIASTWTVVSGVQADDILDVRDYFDAYVGRTVAHYLSLATTTRSEVYIQFASPLQAAQAVRTSSYSFNVENGTAAEGLRSFSAANGMPERPPRSLELMVGWCRDQVFLEWRERLRRRMLEARPRCQRGAALESASSTAKVPHTSELLSPPSSASPSLESSARGSDVAAATGGNDEDAAAHPLLPRHRMRPLSSPSASHPSTAGETSPSRFSATVSARTGDTVSGNLATSAHPLWWDSKDYHQYNRAYHCENNIFPDDLYGSFNGAGRQHATLLSLFFHPCSSSPRARWTRFLYYPLRFVVLLLWTVWNMLAQLLPSSSVVFFKGRQASRRQPEAAPRGVATAVATQPPSPPTAVPQTSRWRLRRSLRAADVVPASASPFEFISFLLYKYIPFAPEPQEVDVALWSWLVLHSPYPQQNLRLLKQSLLVRQQAVSTMTGRLHAGGGLDVAAADTMHWTRFEKVDGIGRERLTGWEAQQPVKRCQELPVLLVWRPAWWFARYSSLSLFMLVVLVYWYS
ncbi:Nup53/35/40-type RNA recognition motif containing protein, putative [Leishmania guyanensis]